jgi:hypothetical protein
MNGGEKIGWKLVDGFAVEVRPKIYTTPCMKFKKGAVHCVTNRKKSLLGCVLTTTMILAEYVGYCAQTAIEVLDCYVITHSF